MEFRLLGPLEVASDTGQAPELTRMKERCLLAVLLMNAGQVLSREKLTSCVWEDDPQGAADGTFRSYMVHVRRAVEAAGDGAQLARNEGGYQLRVRADRVDVHRFARLRHEADAAARSGHTEQAVALLCEAEALWRGPALANIDGRWAADARTALEEERRTCLLKRMGLELELGHHSELLGELRRMRAQYPDDETCAAQEMTALYRCGRQADALEAHRRIRDRLIDSGLEPGPELAELQQRILRGDLPGPDTRRQPPPAPPFSPIPQLDTAFVGRAEEIRSLTAGGVDSPRVRIISGLPGVGKSRLALEAAVRLAGEFPDGRLHLEFHANEERQAPIDTPEALRRLLETVGVSRGTQPDGSAELAALWKRELAARRMIVILDDVPDTETVAPLLPADGPCRVFITSRPRLRGVGGASELELDVLPEQEAITLFRQIAGADRVGDTAAAVEAVRLCGRLPLAITLTAGRLRQGGAPLNSPEPADTLSDSADDLPGASDAGSEELNEMNEQLVSVLDAACRALTADEQQLFLFLGVSPCPSFTTGSAAAIADISLSAAGTVIATLLDRHLVKRSADGEFRLHDLLRDYAALRSRTDVSQRDRRAAELRLLDYYVRRAGCADRELYPHRWHTAPRPTSPPQPRSSPESSAGARDWLESEWRNALRAAEYAGRHEWQRQCAMLAHTLAEFLEERGVWEEAVSVHTRAVRACRDLGERPWTARALIDLSHACQSQSLRQAAFEHAQEALHIFRSVGDRHGEATALNRIGVICLFSGKFREALACGQEAQSLYAEVGDHEGEAEAGFHCGIACMQLGRLSESLSNFHESLAVFERSGNLHGITTALNSLGDATLRQGYHRDALDYYQKALSICRVAGARQRSATVMQNIGHVYLYKGRPERAITEFKCALATFRHIRYILGQARALCDCGDAYLAMDDYEQCLVYYREAASVAEEISDLYVRVVALRGIADACRGSEHADEAMRYYNEALKLVQEVEEPYQHAVILDGIAATMIRAGRVGEGRIYLRQARDLYRAAGAVEANTADLRLQVLGAPPAGGDLLPAASA